MTRTPPGPLPPERARLASALRDLKAGTGLSLAALAAKTTFSKSSWERYLNGRTLPPREAVRELCRLAGEPEGRCLALWELAESEWSGRAAPTAPAAPPAQPEPKPQPEPEPEADARRTAAGGRGALLAVLASVCAIAAGGLSVALVLLAGRSGDPPPSPPPTSAPAPRCRGATCEGKSPMSMRCGESPLTLASHRTSSGAHLELRYSDKCEAGWARMWSTRIGDRLELNRTDGGRRPHIAEITDGIAAQSYVYTPMTEARPGTTVRACFRPVTGGSRECFDAVV
ncbi:helix-turn-helix domain-containing protein [Streptomyces afghaniensis]|uniref:helix-turn-helix domain-containing protein n=1 Tax=Streptomyces afghaniensis TaxID=66865 RepID=UPI00277DDEDC|nr:XRE family transcriptional regulator [Streptomyces afghaniensis]MDQ1017266.1 transcriptional regulator with XRE-family HTH domain [Streptomyces afghaniensis]